MFPSLVSNLRHEFDIVRRAVRTNELLRFAFANPLDANANIDPLVDDIQKNLPNTADWRIYTHCASITRLYSIYDGFVDNLLTDWLTLIPSLVQNYTELDAGIRKTHQQSVGQLLQDLDQKRYRHIQPQQVLQGLYYGVSGQTPYDLFPKAFLKHSQNLRKDILVGMFERSGIHNCWSWVEAYGGVQDFIINVRGNGNTAEAELQDLLDYRNEASHSYVITEVLSGTAILEKADFLEAVCFALVELVTKNILEYRVPVNQAQFIGTITEVFKKSEAVVATMKVKDVQLFVGQELYLYGPTTCHPIRIESIQINDIPAERVTIDVDLEVGLKLGELPKNNSQLFQM